MSGVRKKGAFLYGVMSREVQTLFGPVRIGRQRYRCRGCGKTFYGQSALFDRLGEGRISERVWSVAIPLALHAPYEEVSRLLNQTLGTRLSATRLQQEVVCRGAEESQRQGKKAHAKALFAEAPEPVPPSRAKKRYYVEMDGDFVHHWHERGNFEIKVGAIFSDPILTESGRRRFIPNKQYVSFAGDSEVFGERLFARGETWNLSQAGELYLLGDGASWIKSPWSLYFPHATFLWDWWHVRKAVAKTFRELLKDEEERDRRQEAVVDLLFEGKVAEALEKIACLPAKTRKQEETRDALLGYLLSNKEGLPNYKAVQEQGIHIGSGVIEKSCMDIVTRRMKNRNMSWTQKGAEALLCLRTIYLNNEWNQYWHNQEAKKAA